MNAKRELEKVIIDEDKVNKILWSASNRWHNTHSENALGYIRYLAAAIAKAKPIRVKT